MLAMALLIALPYILYTFRSEYQGMVPFRTNDDGFYMGRLDSVLEGRFSEFQNGITGSEAGVAPAFLELFFGSLFSWTGLHGPELSILLTIFIAPLTIPLTTSLLRASGANYRLSLLGAASYTFAFLGPLQRPIYMSLALPMAFAALLALVRTWEAPRMPRILLTSLLIGILPGVYFWDFSFVFAVAGWFLLLHFILVPKSKWKSDRSKALLQSAGLTLLVSAPIFLKLFAASSAYPFSLEVTLRNQVVFTRMIESLPRNILLTILTLFCILLFRSLHKNEENVRVSILPLALVLGAWTVMHQNLFHGVLLSFSSHYYPFVCLAMVAVSAWALSQAPKSALSFGILSITAVFLLLGAWDYRLAWTLPFASREHLTFQHLAPVLRHLDDGVRENVLTDYRTAQMVTNWTDDDTVFTPYVRHLLVSNQEFAERYCLTELPNPTGPDIRWIAWETLQIRAQDLLPKRMNEFQAVCDDFLMDPRAALEKYRVDYLLWNQRERPTWKIDEELFTKVEEGEGWSLYRVSH